MRSRATAFSATAPTWLLALALGCGVEDPPEELRAAPAGSAAAPAGGAGTQAAPPKPSPSPNPFGMLGSLFAARADEPGPYEDPRHSPDYDEDEEHAVVLELDRPLVELRSLGFLGGAGGIELREVVEQVGALARSREVSALVVRFGGPDMDMTAAEELRAAFAGFRRAAPAGRKIHCHTDGASNVTYFAMAACDSIGLAPGGEVVISGAAAVPIHVKGALDRLGVQADFLHVGAFKGAAEPLTRDRPSPEMMETLGAILDERFAALVDGIAEGRHIPPDRVRELIDTAAFPARAAHTGKLVDQVVGFEDFRDQVLDGAQWTLLRLGGGDEPDMSELMRFLGVEQVSRPTAPHVALVYAVGNVVDGEGAGRAGARREIAPRVLGPALRALAADKSVKAVVLRIDSGGGSALASENLWQTVAELRKQKPVIVSMGAVAASGGYYIACGANQVFASRTTLTGSIGVVGGKLAIGQALGKIGITGHPIGRGKRALLWSGLSRWTADERSVVQMLMQTVYDGFIARVAEGRQRSVDAVQAVAQGRVWTGKAAAERGLIDRIGGLDDALAAARELAGLDEKAPLEVYPPPPGLLDLIGDLGPSLPFGLDLAGLAGREAETVAALYRQIAAFGESRVQTALLLPVVFQ